MRVVVLAPNGPSAWGELPSVLAEQGVETRLCVGQTNGPALHTVRTWDMFSPAALERLNGRTAIGDTRTLEAEDLRSSLKILDRIDGSGRFGLDARHDLVARFMGAWGLFLDTHCIDAVFASNVAHITYDHPLYLACKQRGIPMIMAIRGISPELLGYATDPTGPLLVLPNNTPLDVGTLEQTLVNPYNQQANPDYMTQQARQERSATRKRLWKLLKGQDDWKYKTLHDNGPYTADLPSPTQLRIALQRIRTTRALPKAYAQHTHAQLPARYVYAPLHYQPEATTAPMCGVWSNPFHFLRTLRQELPEDVGIVTKEHPTTFRTHLHGSFGRGPGFYSHLASIPGLWLAQMDTPSHDLIQGSEAVATPGGTASWEAVLQGKNGRMAGWGWISDAPGMQLGAPDGRTWAQRLLYDTAPDTGRVLVHLQERLTQAPSTGNGLANTLLALMAGLSQR
jgi:hypothetical protein